MMRMNRRGFTLVELMVVLAILGLLAGIGIPQYLSTLNRARLSADLSTLGTVQAALNSFMAETGWTPDDVTGFEAGDPLSEAISGITAGGIDSIMGTGKVLWTDFWTGALPVAKASTSLTYDAGADIVSTLAGVLSWEP